MVLEWFYPGDLGKFVLGTIDKTVLIGHVIVR